MSHVNVHLNASVFLMFTCMNIWLLVCVVDAFLLLYVKSCHRAFVSVCLFECLCFCFVNV